MRLRRGLFAVVLGLAMAGAPVLGMAPVEATVGATTLIGTTASSQTVGSAIHDTATLSGGDNPTGTITFQAWGPSDAPDCSGAAVFTSTVSVNGTDTYVSGDFTPSTAGNYYWVASYSGDAGNLPSFGSCGDSGETSTVGRMTTLLGTVASSEIIGSAVHDVATLSGATANAGGTITFNLYGPSSIPDCSGVPVYSQSVPVNGSGDYSSSNFTPATAGSYYWTASYSGDVNNLASPGSCGESRATSVLLKRTTLLGTAASSQVVGSAVHDVATLSGATANAGGTITFNLYGPSATADCSGLPVFTSTVNVSGSGNYGSGEVTPSSAGNYSWVASYSGDVNNLPSSGLCGDTGETSTVGKQLTSIATTATSATAGSSVHDTATLTGATATAGGTITFNLYGPSDTADCSGVPVFTSTVNVSGPGNYGSGDVTPSTPGSYSWVASYSGDVNNQPASTSCGDAGETSTVSAKSQSITFGTLADRTLGVAPFSVSATASSGLTVSFASTTPSVCTVSGSTVTLVAVGTCSIEASQSGNGTWAAAPSVTRSLTVGYALANVTPRGKSTFKAGSTIPVKFRLSTAGGVLVSNDVASTLVRGCAATVTFDGGNPSCAKYDASTHQFQVNLSTSSTLARKSSHTISIEVVVGGAVVTRTSFTVVAK